MPDDVRQALDRFQQFIAGFGSSVPIDEASGFCVADAMLLIGEVQLHAGQTGVIEENPLD